MSTYSITAVITKIDSANKINISGVGKHRYEKSKDEVYNLMENISPQLSNILKLDTAFSFAKSSAVKTTLFAMAMLNKKPLKLTIQEKEIEKNASGTKKKYQYSITDIEVP